MQAPSCWSQIAYAFVLATQKCVGRVVGPGQSEFWHGGTQSLVRGLGVCRKAGMRVMTRADRQFGPTAPGKVCWEGCRVLSSINVPERARKRMALRCEGARLVLGRREKEVKRMETFLSILMVLGIYLGIPLIIAFTVAGVVILGNRRAIREQRALSMGEATDAVAEAIAEAQAVQAAAAKRAQEAEGTREGR